MKDRPDRLPVGITEEDDHRLISMLLQEIGEDNPDDMQVFLGIPPMIEGTDTVYPIPGDTPIDTEAVIAVRGNYTDFPDYVR